MQIANLDDYLPSSVPTIQNRPLSSNAKETTEKGPHFFGRGRAAALVFGTSKLQIRENKGVGTDGFPQCQGVNLVGLAFDWVYTSGP